MHIAVIGLGRMGANIVRRLRRAGIEVVGYNRHHDVALQLQAETGMEAADSLAQTVSRLTTPRLVWLMLPAGEVTEMHIEKIQPLLETGDVLVDGANSNYKDSQRRARQLAQHDIQFVDVGVSGGVWGLEEGFCLMAGGEAAAVERLLPVFKALAPAPDRGWAHVGPAGAGHYTKMIHNGIEYGMMQAYAEGFSLLEGKREMNLDLAQIAELWRHGSVVRSWLLDLTAGVLQEDSRLEGISPYVADSGEGRWTVHESIEQGLPAPVLTLALQMRFASQDQEQYGNRLLAMMRHAFGGHAVKKED
jgi:6-phosphogluconate dehydrogenase